VDGASVTAEVTEQGRGPKIKVFKRWRRNDSRKMRGHRQEYTSLLIRSINPTPDAVGRGVAETSAEG
jgi:large subunit ribosomal protein L21